MRLVLDTNAAVSGLLWHGNPGKLIDVGRGGSVTLYTSAPLLAELRGVLEREKFDGLPPLACSLCCSWARRLPTTCTS